MREFTENTNAAMMLQIRPLSHTDLDRAVAWSRNARQCFTSLTALPLGDSAILWSISFALTCKRLLAALPRDCGSLRKPSAWVPDSVGYDKWMRDPIAIVVVDFLLLHYINDNMNMDRQASRWLLIHS